MKITTLKVIFFLLIHASVCAQYMGGEGSGSKGTNFNWINCYFFTSGGAYSGAASDIKQRDFECTSFYGTTGSGYLAEVLNRVLECNMYMGDTVSGYHNTVVKRVEECNMYMGESHSGAKEDYFFNPLKCLMYTASIAGGSGFYVRALSEDTLICQVIPLGMDCSPLYGDIIGTQGVLNWYTLKEYRNSGFEVFRSYDGYDWKRISWISGMGTSFDKVDYQYVDKDISHEGQYYRFKQLDFEGNAYWSNIVHLKAGIEDKQKELYTVFPNPSVQQNTLTLKSWTSIGRAMNIQILDGFGRVIWEDEHAFSTLSDSYIIPSESLEAGTYYLRLLSQEDDVEITLTFVVLK